MYTRNVPGLINLNDKVVKRPYILQNPTLMWLKRDNEHNGEKTQNESRDWLHDTIPIWSRLNKCNSSGEYRQITKSITKNYDIEIDGILLSLWGNLHPNVRPFPEKRRGKQYLACCVMALCATRIYPVGEWSSEILDSILTNGDRYYLQCIKTPSFSSTESVDETILTTPSNTIKMIASPTENISFQQSDSTNILTNKTNRPVNILNTNVTYNATILQKATMLNDTSSSTYFKDDNSISTTSIKTSTTKEKSSIKSILSKKSKKKLLPEKKSIVSSFSLELDLNDFNKRYHSSSTIPSITSKPRHYQHIAISILRNDSKILPGQLTINDLNADCWLDSVHFNINIKHVTDGKLYCAPNNHYSNLAESLMYFFSNFELGILQCLKRCLAFGFVPGPMGGYFLYDCQSREFPLFGKNQGTTYTLLSKNLQMLLYCMVVTLNVHTFHEPFSLYAIEVKTNFFNPIGQMENKKSVTWKTT